MHLKNFAILRGNNATNKDGKIILQHVENLPGRSVENKAEDLAYAEIRSDQIFTNGNLQFKYKTDTAGSGALALFQSQNDETITAGFSFYNKEFQINFGKTGLKPFDSAGNPADYTFGEEHIVRVAVNGSRVNLFVDKILICEATISLKQAPVAFRFVTDGFLEIYDFDVETIKPKVFVVMQFTQDYNELYTEVIRPIVEQNGYECVRADEFYTSTPILRDIIESIQQSSIVIAEITPDNPNVFYEIGYSHAIEKPTILLCDHKRGKLPFDVSSFRTLFYDNTIAGKKRVEQNLSKYLEGIK